MTDSIKHIRRSLVSNTENKIELKIAHGKVPKWLNGIYFRNGPGRYEFSDNRTYEHTFDGQAIIQRFEISNGRVFYTNRFLDTKSYTKSVNTKQLYPNFGRNEQLKGFWNFIPRLISFYLQPETNDNFNINLAPYAHEQLYAMSETNRFSRINPANLSIMFTNNIKNYVSTIMTTIAHPHIEKDGSWITCGLNPLGFGYEFLKYTVKNDGTGYENCCNKIEVIGTIPSNHFMGLAYFHSFGITDNYIIFLEQSLVISYWHLFVSLLLNNPISECFKVKKNFETRIHIIEKHTGKLLKQRFKTIPQFSFHIMNCYEVVDNLQNLSEICVDICSYDVETFDLANFTYENMYSGKYNESNELKAMGKRITIPMNIETSNVIFCDIREINSNTPFELPVINYRKNNGKMYQFSYGVTYYKCPFAVIKLYVQKKKGPMLKLDYVGKGNDLLLPSEPIFVERLPFDEKSAEDDGVLLVMVLSKDYNDFLSILDAKTMKEIARCEVIGVKFAFSFHGFFADKKIFPKLNK